MMIWVIFAAYNVFKLLIKYNIKRWLLNRNCKFIEKYDKKDTIILLRSFVKLLFIDKKLRKKLRYSFSPDYLFVMDMGKLALHNGPA